MRRIQEEEEQKKKAIDDINQENRNFQAFQKIDSKNETMQQKKVQDKFRETMKAEKEEIELERERMRKNLEEELKKERQFMKKLPDEIHTRIKAAMNNELEHMKGEMNNNTSALREQIMTLRAQALDIDSGKTRATEEIGRLRSNLANLHYEDEIRTHELIESLAAENCNRILPSSSTFNNPERLYKHPRDRIKAPIDYYGKNRFIKGEEKMYSDAYFQPADIDPIVMDFRGNDKGYARNFDDKYDDMEWDAWKYDNGWKVENEINSNLKTDQQTNAYLIGLRNDERLSVFDKVVKDGNDDYDILNNYLNKDLSEPIFI